MEKNASVGVCSKSKKIVLEEMAKGCFAKRFSVRLFCQCHAFGFIFTVPWNLAFLCCWPVSAGIFPFSSAACITTVPASEGPCSGWLGNRMGGRGEGAFFGCYKAFPPGLYWPTHPGKGCPKDGGRGLGAGRSATRNACVMPVNLERRNETWVC